MRHLKQYLALCLLATVLSACTAVGIPTASTFNEKLAVGYSLVTQTRQTTTTLLTANKITADDGAQVLAQTDNARTGLDLARTMSATNLTQADSKLTAIKLALTALQTYLATRG